MLIRNKSHRHAIFSLKESSANPSQCDLTIATPAPPSTLYNRSPPFIS